MKNTKTCPKCGSRDIIRVPKHSVIAVGSFGLLTSVPVIRFVCGGCGYSEEWIESAEDRKRVKERYGTA